MSVEMNGSRDIRDLTKDELVKQYHEAKKIGCVGRMLPPAHRLWCLAYPGIPENFSSNFIKLLEKLERVAEMVHSDKQPDEMQFEVLVDSIYMDCRSMFCENDRQTGNYTLQNCLRTAGVTNAATWMDEIFKKQAFTNEKVKSDSFFSWVKFVTDKSLAHKDPVPTDKQELLDYRYDFFRDEMNLHEFTFIIFQANEVYVKAVTHYAEIQLLIQEAAQGTE